MSGDTAFSLAPRAAPARRDRQRARVHQRGRGRHQHHQHELDRPGGGLLPAAPPHAGQPRLRRPAQPEEPGADDGDDPRGQAGGRRHRDRRREDEDPAQELPAGARRTRRSSACRPTPTARWRATCSPPPTRSCRTRPRCRSCRRWCSASTSRRRRSTWWPRPRRSASRPTQLIIEASLAQAEGGSVSDYPKIAEVIHNRLAIGMHLQFDSTVLYGLGKYAVSATDQADPDPGAVQHVPERGAAGRADLQPGRRGDPGHPAPGHGQLAVLPDQAGRQVPVLRRPR